LGGATQQKKRSVRHKLSHDTKTREKIRTSHIIKRLEKHIDGELDMSASQVRAAEILINRTLPILSAVEMESNVVTNHVVSSEPLDVDEWLKKHGPPDQKDITEH